MTKTIAWIEDDVHIIDPVVEPLEDAGYKVMRFQTVSDALSAVGTIQKADLILLDMLIRPGGIELEPNTFPGLELLRVFREVYGVTAPVVILSVVRRSKILAQASQLGISEILMKPIRPSELKLVVEKILRVS